MIEIERKYRLNDELKRQIVAKLRKDHGNLQSEHQVDEVFLLNKTGFHEFYPGDPVFRLREINGQYILTLKKTVNQEGDAFEHEFTVSSYDEAKSFLLAFGCVSVVIVEKTRQFVKLDDMAIAVDDVKRLGTFLEIEIVADKESSEIMDRIKVTADSFGLGPELIESKKYDRLLQELK